MREQLRCTLGKQSPRCAGQLVTQIDVPSLLWTVVVPAWLRANSHTIRYITTHNIANPLHHTVTQVQHRPGKRDDSSEHLLAELGQLSPNTLTQRKNWRCKPSKQEMSVMFAAGWEHPTTTETVWMNIWGVTQPGMGTWSLRTSLFLGWGTWLIVGFREIILSLISKYKKLKNTNIYIFS